MIKCSNRSDIPTFLALEGMRKAQELEAAGQDIIHLEIGQPSTAAPEAVTQALVASVADTGTHG